MLEIQGIDEEKCIKCLKCVEDCPVSLFRKLPTEVGEKREIIFEDEYNTCIKCGHCISICPTDAVIFESDQEPVKFEKPLDPSEILEYEALKKAMRARRSIRKYKDKPVAREEINSVLDAMRYAPSARNAQEWEYVILTEPESIMRVRKATEKMLMKLRKILKIGKKIRFLLPKSLKEGISPSNENSLDNFYKEIEEGKDGVFYEAPVVIIASAKESYGSDKMILNDAGLAFGYGMLAAQSRGLGTCWIGFAQMAVSRSKNLKEWLGIPEDRVITGVMIMGYPAVKYKKLPIRKPLNVQWK
ncbi:MAG: 4Fe-4S dicluster domain-containing protein [Promethearchaeota archaeon]|nr:MAG: 4Fe-4S dicluster domain-containing protein [Candidatus Lokiarchaeota archaeon]